MHIQELISRHRNDFHFICACRHCGHAFRRGDGYADSYFQTVVVPNQHCPNCGLNEHRETSSETAARFAKKRELCTENPSTNV